MSKSRIPDILYSLAAPALLQFEDPVGLDRPLWRDLSRYQGEVNFSIAVANGVLGMAARAAISWGYQDAWFPANWIGAGQVDMYRTSYHVIYPSENVTRQADNWYRVHPEIETIPRVIDLELSTNMTSRRIADATWNMSNIVLERDGVRPIIYSRYQLINAWLVPYWSVEQLNDHYYWLAQFLYDRVREHPGPPTLPLNVKRENVAMHQTADKKPGFPGEVQSRSVDYDRWEIGNEAEMHQWINSTWGSGGIIPAPTYLIFKVTSEKTLANEIVGYNAADKPVMKIWEGDGFGGRIRYNKGQTLRCAEEIIEADGGKEWHQYRDAPSGAPDLFFEKSRMEIASAPSDPFLMQIINDGLRIRSEPSTNGAIVGVFEKNTVVELVQDIHGYEGWGQIKTGDYAGNYIAVTYHGNRLAEPYQG